MPGVFEHIYSLSAIMQDALSNKKPLMVTFIDLKNAFGSVSHHLIFDMLRAVKVPSSFFNYVFSFYSQLSVTITSDHWETAMIPFQRGVFQGDTLSPMIFLLVFNPLLQLADSLNNPCGYTFQLPVPNCDSLPPVGSFVYIKWSESGDEEPGWYKAHIDKYLFNGFCKLVYKEDIDTMVFEEVDLHQVDWKPCGKRAKRFVPLTDKPATVKSSWKSSPKFVDSIAHSVKGYADDATLISTNLETHSSVLQEIDKKAADLDLTLKPSKCVSFLFDGSKHLSQRIPLSGGTTKLITEGGTKFLGKLIDVSLSATKSIANKNMTSRLSGLLTATDSLPVRGEYKLWIYRNYILSLLRFHLCVDAITNHTIKQLESMVSRYLKKWLQLPRNATRVILYYPGICCPSVSCVSREAKLSLLSCICASSDPQLQELGLHLHLGNDFLQFQNQDYSILSAAQSQLSDMPSARSLYKRAKDDLTSKITSDSEAHLNQLTVQCKFLDSARLETSCRTWNKLMTGFHPGQLSFLLRASSDTLPTAVNLRRWHIQCGAKCTLCDSNRPTTAHILGGCPIALSQQRYTYRHNQVLFTLISQLITLFSDCQMVSVYADLQGHRFNDSPPETIPSNVLVTPYRPDVVIYNRHSASMGIIELTCPLDSIHHLESAHNRKLYKPEYVQLLAELDRLKIPHCYRTVEWPISGEMLADRSKMDLLPLIYTVVEGNREKDSVQARVQLYAVESQ
ncbi:uncharacterized protein [Dysidea avara]|uniref:uncharacterized protein n=1 Tax=Dysidea avara TaxID=196820 RepID=UPI0033216E81